MFLQFTELRQRWYLLDTITFISLLLLLLAEKWVALLAWRVQSSAMVVVARWSIVVVVARLLSQENLSFFNQVLFDQRRSLHARWRSLKLWHQRMAMVIQSFSLNLFDNLSISWRYNLSYLIRLSNFFFSELLDGNPGTIFKWAFLRLQHMEADLASCPMRQESLMAQCSLRQQLNRWHRRWTRLQPRRLLLLLFPSSTYWLVSHESVTCTVDDSLVMLIERLLDGFF